MNPELEETITCDFITSSPTTGAAIDADSAPLCEVFEDATDTAILTPVAVKRSGKTGNYRIGVACSAANGFEAGKSYNIVASATVGGVVAKAVVQTFQMRTNGADDLATSILTRATPANVDTSLAAVGLTTTVTGRLDVAVSTRATPANVDASLTTYGAVKPTVAGRTLDITATGEAGVDWANIGAPTTAVNLSATTISTAQTVASVSGAVGSVTGAVASVTNPVTLTAAYDAAKTAAPVGAAMTLTAGERTTVAGVIWNVLTSTLTTASTIGKLLVDNLDAKISSAVGAAGGDTPGTTTLLGRIASALTITAGAVNVNDKTGFALTTAYDKAKTAAQPGDIMALTSAYDPAKSAAPVGAAMTLTPAYDKAKTAAAAGDAMTLTTGERTTLTGAIWNVLTSAMTTAGSVGKLLADNVNATISSRAVSGDAMTLTSGERASLATAIWNTLTGALSTAGSVGKLIVDNLNATISSRSAAGDAMSLTSAERTTTAGVIWNVLASALSTANTIGKLIVDNLNATVSSRSTYDGDKTGFSLVAAYDPAKTAMQAGAAVTLVPAYDAAKGAATQTSVDGVKLHTDHLGTAMEQDGPVWRFTANALETAPTGSGTGGGVADWTDTEKQQIRSRLGLDGTAVEPTTQPTLANQSSVNGVKTNTDHLATAMEQDGPVYRFTVNALEQAPTGTGGGGIADWTVPERDQIRHRLGIDGNSSTPTATPSLANQASVNAVKTKTDQLAFVSGDVVATLSGEPVAINPADLVKIADAILKRDWEAITGEAAYSLLNAARCLRNVWDANDGTFTVKKEDGTTAAWTRSLTTDPTAQPIVGAE